MPDSWEQLRQVQIDMRQAEAKRDDLAKQWRDAVYAVQEARDQRLALLDELTAGGTSSADMAHAARVLGVTTPRVYQLVRKYRKVR